VGKREITTSCAGVVQQSVELEVSWKYLIQQRIITDSSFALVDWDAIERNLTKSKVLYKMW